MKFVGDQAAKIAYVVALYDNAVTTEIRNALKPYITDLQVSMDILNNMGGVFRKKLTEFETTPIEAVEIISSEYELLEMNQWLDFSYIEEILLFSMYAFHQYGYNNLDIHDMIVSIMDKADTADTPLKIDMYCCAIKVLDRYNLVTEEMELAQRAIDFYNSIPEDDRCITILPDALTAF